MAETTPYKTRGWPRIRLAILERDDHECQIRGEGCTRKATDCDHIIDWRDGGAWLDPDNLRASCGHCNRSRSSHQKHQNGWRRSATEIILVTGPNPNSLRDLISPSSGDSVIDHLALVEAFTPSGNETGPEHEQLAGLAWGAAIRELRRGEIIAPRVWLLSTDAHATETLPHTSVIDAHDNPGGPTDVPEGLEADRW